MVDSLNAHVVLDFFCTKFRTRLIYRSGETDWTKQFKIKLKWVTGCSTENWKRRANKNQRNQQQRSMQSGMKKMRAKEVGKTVSESTAEASTSFPFHPFLFSFQLSQNCKTEKYLDRYVCWFCLIIIERTSLLSRTIFPQLTLFDCGENNEQSWILPVSKHDRMKHKKLRR